MFSYFGSKSKIVHLYPKPEYDRIIEPFAGSARYACRYYRRRVWINDVNPVIFKIWKWIVRASPDEVRALPELRPGEKLSDIKTLSEPERLLLGLCVNEGTSHPCNQMTARSFQTGGGRTIGPKKLKTRLLSIVGKIGHWRVTNESWEKLPIREATWFVDPPYQNPETGSHYPFNKIDYPALGRWCRGLPGQVIACEGTGADWLSFVPIRTLNRQSTNGGNYQELVWTKCDKKVGFIF